MGPKALTLAMLGCSCLAAQVTVAGHTVELHGFFSQGFAKSNDSNYLTMQTSRGAFDFTDGGFNISTQLTDKFRVGAQAYVRNFGHLGNGHLTLDWANGDYRFKDYFGIRFGRVKTVLGLYNDTQDMEFLHTWALIPQSLYPLDLRGLNISHLGGDVYGSISPRKWGTFSYTAYLGTSPPDRSGGREYAFESYGLQLTGNKGRLRGADLKWNTPVRGLLLGGSFLDSPTELAGSNRVLGGGIKSTTQARNLILSAQYSRGRLRVDFERSRALSRNTVEGSTGLGDQALVLEYDARGWYGAVAYRLSPHLEIGTYHSRFYPNADRQVAYLPYQPPAARHIFDQATTARFDFKTHWDIKVEGHLIHGYGDPGQSRGLYLQDNPAGLNPKTRLLVIRLGFNY